jgi:flagellar hook-associated protein 1
MSLTGIMSAARSGLQTAQTGMTTVSNNITNVNTPGYAREVVSQSPAVVNGVGVGVTVDEVERVTNSFLEAANYGASSQLGSANIISNLVGQAQSAFGDPTQATSYLNQLSTVFSDFTAAANDPASSLPRDQALSDLGNFLDSTQNVADTLNGLNDQADTQISSDVSTVNSLLSQINSININISKIGGEGADISGSQDDQSQLLNQLSSLLSIGVTTNANGTVSVYSTGGQLLVGNGNAATLTYNSAVSGFSTLSVAPAGLATTTTMQAGDGELAGLMTLRNSTIPGIQNQLSSYVSGAVSAINSAHNANTADPPPQTLTGRNTGLDLPTVVGDFSGTTNIAVVDASGNLTQQVAIDFSADTMSVNGGAATSFTPATFLSSLNTALGGTGTASFSNGALSISATASGSGVAIADGTPPSSDGGQGFSQFFGMNDLISSSEITNYNTGLKATDASGFTPGGVISLQVATADGKVSQPINITMPAAGSTMQDVVNTLNAGVSSYGSFSLDSNGALTFSPSTSGSSIAVMSDNTQRGANGPSLTQLFGIGVSQQASRAGVYDIRPDIAADPTNMALAQLDLTAPAGTPVVAAGDGSGATALASVGNANTNFGAAGVLPAQFTSVMQYAANMAGSIGQQASAATSAATAATSVQTEAQTRLQSVEGVNLDEELVNLTTYQQAYNASSRLIQASKDMINTLLDMVP